MIRDTESIRIRNATGFINVGTEENQEELINNSKPYTTLIDDYTTTNKTYIGKAIASSSESSAVWQIKCLDETGTFLKTQFAGGVSTFTKTWGDRTTYTYS